MCAGVSSLLGVLWKDFCSQRNVGLDLHVYAFGPPPCLSPNTCKSTKDYITTINNNDCMPRLTTNSLNSLEKLLVFADKRLKMLSLSPRDMPTARRNLSEIPKLSPKALLGPEEIALSVQHCGASDEALAVPGNILCVWNLTQDPTILGVNSMLDASPLLTELVMGSSMIYDHTAEAYRANLELLVEQTANTI